MEATTGDTLVQLDGGDSVIAFGFNIVAVRGFVVEVVVFTRGDNGRSFLTVGRIDCAGGLIMVAVLGFVVLGCVVLFTPSLVGRATVRVSRNKNKATEAITMSAFRQTMYPEINGSINSILIDQVVFSLT
jgi:hypothetical protein